MSRTRVCRARFASVAALAIAGGMHVALALDSIALDTPQLEGNGWRAEGFSLRLHAGTEPASADLSIDQVLLPGPISHVRAVRAHCAALRVVGGVYACSDASAQFVLAQRGRVELHGRFTYDAATRTLELDGVARDAANAPLTLHAVLAGDRWTVDLDTSGYAVATLAPWLSELVRWTETAQPAGSVALHARAEGRGAQLELMHVEGVLSGLTMSAFDDRLAAETLDGTVELDARPLGGSVLAIELALRGTAGHGYVDPWFIDAGAHPFTMRGKGSLNMDSDALTLTELRIDQPGVVVGTGTAVLEPHLVRSLVLDLDEADLPGLYEIYLQPVFIGTSLDELDTQGQARGHVEFADGALVVADLRLESVHAEDRHGRFAVYGVSGDARWRLDPAAPTISDLHYTGAALYGVPFDAGRLRLESAGAAMHLLDTPVRVSLLEGALAIQTLALRGLDSEDVQADFDATLEPVDVAKLTSALGWVPFAGTLSGRLPTLRYAGGVLTLGGALEAEVFGGQIRIDGLRVEEPLGVLPTLHADIRMRDIDLERLTSTFSFGHMTGRLHADVLGLEAVDWRAERFDARIYTPPEDTSRHRISQRAVQSIASIGGGGSAGFSSGIMRLFDEFNYDRIDLSCQMRDQVCAMQGLEAKGRGYYILRGRGLPHIDVIGYEHSVSWPALAAAVWSAATSKDVVIE